jgi:hypothetical protein
MKRLLLFELPRWMLHLILLIYYMILPHVKASIYDGSWPKIRHTSWQDHSHGCSISQKLHGQACYSRNQHKKLFMTSKFYYSPDQYEIYPIPNSLRGGEIFTPSNPISNIPLDNIMALLIKGITVTVQRVLPPLVGIIKSVLVTYRLLPQDALLAQAGIVYCFCGGCYPTLFAAVQAARHCGMEPMICAIRDLTDQAIVAVEATAAESASSTHSDNDQEEQKSAKDIFLQTTRIVMRSVDPVKVM